MRSVVPVVNIVSVSGVVMLFYFILNTKNKPKTIVDSFLCSHTIIIYGDIFHRKLVSRLFGHAWDKENTFNDVLKQLKIKYYSIKIYRSTFINWFLWNFTFTCDNIVQLWKAVLWLSFKMSFRFAFRRNSQICVFRENYITFNRKQLSLLYFEFW